MLDVPYQSSFIQINNTKIFIRNWGTKENCKHIVLFWHGRGSTGLCFNEIAPVLFSQFGLYTIAIDAPGLGNSEMLVNSSYTPSELSVFLKQLLDILEINNIIFVGHSWGATIGCYFAATYPTNISSLVLLDGGYLHATDNPNYDLENSIKTTVDFYSKFRFYSWDDYLAEERKHVKRWTLKLAEAFKTTMNFEDGEIAPVLKPKLIDAIDKGLYTSPPISTYDALNNYHIPILLLKATEPQSFESTRTPLIQRMQNAIPQMEVVNMIGCGHDIISDSGPEVGKIIGAWMLRIL